MSKSLLILALSLFFGLIYYAEARRRRMGGGYLEPVDTDDPEMIGYATWAAKKLKGTFITVTSAQKQVVAGWMYHITMRMKSKEQMMMRCSVKVWIRHWLNSIKLVSARCTPVRT
ncbi:uncharacterized protein LOC123544630 [Mercenaria mercenaria]|uniref:uncharacterized protein LOC123544630 n=1 Tax=Mercenaria mercenaria TaxID=6596 RepID=UPI00234F3C29|nr:uncharacterized protein LOC123544630 [Mercenaria mercenaria]